MDLLYFIMLRAQKFFSLFGYVWPPSSVRLGRPSRLSRPSRSVDFQHIMAFQINSIGSEELIKNLFQLIFISGNLKKLYLVFINYYGNIQDVLQLASYSIY